MIIVNFIKWCRERMGLVVKFCYTVLGALVVLDLVLKFTYHYYAHKAHTMVEKIPGWWSVFGFIACVLIIIVSKWYGHLGIMTREDYYDK